MDAPVELRELGVWREPRVVVGCLHEDVPHELVALLCYPAVVHLVCRVAHSRGQPEVCH